MLLDDTVGQCAIARSMFDVYNAAMQNIELEEEEVIGERRNKVSKSMEIVLLSV